MPLTCYFSIRDQIHRIFLFNIIDNHFPQAMAINHIEILIGTHF